MSGKVLRKQLSGNLATRVETGSFSNGLYVLKVTDDKGKVIRTEKILIQK